MKSVNNKYRKQVYLCIPAFLLILSGCSKSNIKPETITSGAIDNSVSSVISSTQSVVSTVVNGTIPLKNMFGVNGYEWNFLQNPANLNDVSKIFEPKMALINGGFTAVRHYLSWSKLEYTQGDYTFNPSHDGSWNLDAIYERCKQDNILMLADIKDCPNWLVNTYPSSLQNTQNIPVPYGSDPTVPASYILQGKSAFQFAARYGSNGNVDPSLVHVADWSRWTNDPANTVKIGLNEVKYIECDNERDKWWLGAQAQQTPEEYAANMSAFYDGDQGRLGKDVGVKSADPTIKVVMGGLATANVNFVSAMVAWCKTHRGYKLDGTLDLCFDVINYHWYSNDGNVLTNVVASTGVAPELNNAGVVADGFVKLAASLPNHPEVWVTEAGYDINQTSTQRAIPIGNKSALLTQGDWTVRTALLYMRHGVNRLFFYQMYDDVPNGPITFQTAGLINDDLTRRPAANYIVQLTQLMGDYVYAGTLNSDPIVDKYISGLKTMYSLVVPDQKGRTDTYALSTGLATSAYLYTLNPAGTATIKTTLIITNGKVTVNVSETPVFVQLQ